MDGPNRTLIPNYKDPGLVLDTQEMYESCMQHVRGTCRLHASADPGQRVSFQCSEGMHHIIGWLTLRAQHSIQHEGESAPLLLEVYLIDILNGNNSCRYLTPRKDSVVKWIAGH